MPTYHITSVLTGRDYGVYEAPTPDEAVILMLSGAGTRPYWLRVDALAEEDDACQPKPSC